MKVTPSKYKPFMLVTKENEDKKNEVVIIAGNTQVSPLTFETEKEAEKYLTEQPYEMVTNLYSIFKYYEEEAKKRATENENGSKKES